MKNQLKVAIVGTGAFAQAFIPLFKAHPSVSEVVLCDIDADKLQRCSTKFNIPTTYSSLVNRHSSYPAC